MHDVSSKLISRFYTSHKMYNSIMHTPYLHSNPGYIYTGMYERLPLLWGQLKKITKNFLKKGTCKPVSMFRLWSLWSWNSFLIYIIQLLSIADANMDIDWLNQRTIHQSYRQELFYNQDIYVFLQFWLPEVNLMIYLYSTHDAFHPTQIQNLIYCSKCMFSIF